MQNGQQTEPTESNSRLLPNTRSFFYENYMLTKTQLHWFSILSVIGTFIPPVNWFFCVLLRQRKETYKTWYLYNRILSFVYLGVMLGVSNWLLFEYFFGKF